jgi:hypothetical protein
MKDMVPLGIAASGLAIIGVVVAGALGLLYVLLRGEEEYDEGETYESPDSPPAEAERHDGHVS